MCFAHALSLLTQPYLLSSYLLLMHSINLCSSWPTYASKGLGSVTKSACCSPPRPLQTIVALSSSNRLQKIICSFRFASPSSFSTPMTRAGRTAPPQRSSALNYISSCSPLKGFSTLGLSGSIRGWESPAATPNTVYPFFPEMPSRLPLLSTLNRDRLTGITL